MKYFFQTWTLKVFVHCALALIRTIRRAPISQYPTKVVSYPCRPKLKNRVFFPRSRTDDTLLPLYIDVHGGGFCLCDPETDDLFCSTMANRFNILVVSVDYRKAPSAPFPCAVDDVAAIARAVIDDPALPINRSLIAMGGFSAGGNLSFAACQRDELRDAIKAIVGFYPSLDFAHTTVEKLATREHRDRPDGLAFMSPLFRWAYVPDGTNLKDPFLSPLYAGKEAFPKYIYLIAAEDDMLCREAQVMAEKLAAGMDREKLEGLEEIDGWKAETIRWECVLGLHHGFTHTESNGVDEVRRKKIVEDLYGRVGDWLLNEVFA